MRSAESPRPSGYGAARRRGLTLIELIAVMGLLAIVMGFSAPVLSRFFRGRSLEEEGRRLLALTRFARSEAISRSVPMELWINVDARAYGLRAQAGYESGEESKPLEYNLQDGLSFDVAAGAFDQKGEARMVFLPDGAIGEESLESLTIWNADKNDAVEIAKTDPLVGYVIRDPDAKR